MGQVFEAVHEQIQRRAAIKLLHPEFSNDKELVQRFFNEALAVNVVQHPSIVGVFESGSLPNGAAFIVMEFLDGAPLSSHLKTVSLSEREALSIARQIASALAAAHAKDIVHRDLKPDNVMLVKDPEVPGGRRAKLLDFGIAKVSMKHQRNAVKTKDGVMMGTPTYMAPELWMSASTADAKTDVYALGVMLFEMLARQPPFLADNINQIMFKHLEEVPPSVRKHAPHVSAGTAELVAQMLQKDRAQRPDMATVAERVEGLLAQRLHEGSGPIKVAPAAADLSTQETVLHGAGRGNAPDEAPAQRSGKKKLDAAALAAAPTVKRPSGQIRRASSGAMSPHVERKGNPVIAAVVIGIAVAISALLGLFILR